MHSKKIRLNSHVWDHHRSGWKFVIKSLFDSCHSQDGIICEGIAENIFRNNIELNFPWIGFFHDTPYVHINNLERHQKKYFLDGVFEMESWKKSINFCKGIFTFSKYTANFIEDKFPYLPILNLKHSTIFPDIKFDFDKFSSNKKLVFVGDWLRNISSIYNIDYNNKYLLNSMQRNYSDYEYEIFKNHKPVKILNKLNDNDYDNLLSESVVLSHLYESSVNNTVIECIVRNTPILVNRLPAVTEYLGEDYPLYFDSLKEAEDKINDINIIEKSHNYLCNIEKDDLKIDYFIDSFINSFIYRAL